MVRTTRARNSSIVHHRCSPNARASSSSRPRRPAGRRAVAPGDVDPLVLFEAPPGEGEGDGLGPHARADLGVGDSGLLPQLPSDGVDGGLARIDAAAGDLPPLAVATRRIRGVDQQEAVIRVEDHDPGGAPSGPVPTSGERIPPDQAGRRRRRRRARLLDMNRWTWRWSDVTGTAAELHEPRRGLGPTLWCGSTG